MKKWFTLILLNGFLINSFAQDDAVLALPLGSITSPVSGCALSSTETVTVVIFNAGPGTINAPFDVSFNITGPINSSATETVLVGSIPQNSTFAYTFTTTADLSTVGAYSMDATVTVAGDPIPGNNTYVGYNINNDAASDGGTANGSTAVCFGANSGNVTLSGEVGDVINWEYSTDAGVTWFNISNTTTSQSYDDLTTETWYRANVENASCGIATSSIAIITIDATSVGGTTGGGPTTVCSGANAGTITLSGKTGNVLNWEFSIDGGATWTPIANTSTSNPFSNLTTTTRFRALVQNGTCPAVYSNQRVVNVNPNTVPGSVTADATECSGSNAGTVTLGGQTGSITFWQYSEDGGSTWTNITNTTVSQNYTNLTTTTMYRAAVKSGVCPQMISTPATITIVPNSDGGTISSSMTVCEGANDDTLALLGYSGNVIDWEFSIDGGLTFNSTGNTNDSLFFTNITQETVYRAIVQAGSCAPDNSNPVIVSVDAPSVGGNLLGDNTVCASGNSGTVTLSGQTGSPISWEFSDDFGATWNTIANNTTTQNYLNLTDTTLYRALIQNGTCSSVYSDTATINVDAISVGGTINSNTTVCAASNSGTVNLVGETGDVLNWETSTDGGFTWVGVANTTTSQSYLNILSNTLYRAIVQNGVCSSTQSGIVTITVDQEAIAGNIIGATTVCESGNGGSLTLIGSTGSILDWESSTDGGTTWNPEGNLSNIENYLNLIATTDYRVIVTSGVCPNDTTSIATIAVDAVTVPGSVTTDATVCELANSGTLNLGGNNGSVINWEMSTDGGNTWLTLANTSISQNYLDLNTTTSYRAVVKNGVCPSSGSLPATITVSPQSEGGAVSSSETVCADQNFGVLTLTGHEGSILDWEFSNDNGSTWNSLGNTTINQTYNNLSDTTWYRAIVQNGICPNDTSAIAFINLYPAPISEFVQDTVCFGETMNFVNNSTTSSGFITLQSWNFGDGNTSTALAPQHDYAAAGTYSTTLFVLNNFGCSDTVTYDMEVEESPMVDVIALSATEFCLGDSVQLETILDPNYTYLWNTGETTNTIVTDSADVYVVNVSHIVTSCTNSDSIEVIVFDLPIVSAGLDTNVALGYSVELSGTGGTSYSWTPSNTLDNSFVLNPIATPDSTTIYILTVTDDNGCSASDSVLVEINGEILLTIYNIITPNGDGFNDTWIIGNILNFPNNNVSIFNRYGQIVYEANGYVNDWDGTRNGDNLPDGSYYYIIEMTDTGEIYKGTINIVRSAN